MHSPPERSVPPDRAYLKRLLSERNQYPERAAEIDQEVRRAFQVRVAMLALDMCGFSRLTLQHGIIHYLAMIQKMEQAARPAVTGNGGQVIKQEADNLFAIFAQPEQALEAALDILRALEAMNSVMPADCAIHASIGIGYGETLVIGQEDLFGTEMNLACKLGEDVAGKGEILLTPAAREALPPGRYVCMADSMVIGGMEIHCHRYEASLVPRVACEPVEKVV